MTATTSGPSAARERTRFPELDGLRAVGALGVLTTHVGFQSGAALNGSLSAPVARLDVGVALFFVVSGFLLHRPHAAAAVRDDAGSTSWGRYARTRAARILPAYWVALLLTAVVVPQARAEGAGEWVAHVLLVQVLDGEPQVLGLAQTWSLSTEMAFYALLPLLVVLLAAGRPTGAKAWRRHRWLLLALVLGPVWHAVAASADARPETGLWLPGYLGWFVAGMLLAARREALLAGLRRPDWLDALAALPAYCLTGAGLTFLLACTALAGPQDLSPTTPFEAATKNVLYLVVGVLVVLPAVADPGGPGTVRRALRSRPATWTGRISYGIFLYHLPLLFLVEQVTGHEVFGGGFWWLWGATAGLAVAVSWASYRWLEAPVLRAARRGPRTPTTTPASVTAAKS